MEDSILDVLEAAIEADSTGKLAFVLANLVKDKYERLIFQKVKENAFTDKQYNRLRIANQSITAIYKDVLERRGSNDKKNEQ